MPDGNLVRVYGDNLELLDQVMATLPSKRSRTSLVNELVAEAALARLEDDPPSASEVAPPSPPPRAPSSGNAYEDF